jgi:nitrite reductase/ring-hydroxylating ferredoxin subunit
MKNTAINPISTPDTLDPPSTQSEWCYVLDLQGLGKNNKTVVRPNGKQISIFKTQNGIHACDNRCPHEGYPLAEGSLGENCILTCNWHNWKFNLETGENLYGGDKLRTYPVRVIKNEIWLDLADPPFQERYQKIMSNLRDAFDDNEYDRIAREIARLEKIGADPEDALRQAIHWSHEKMEFGFTHAYAGMADWLTMREEFKNNKEIELVCLLEPTSHAAFDVLREPDHPYSTETLDYDSASLVDAIEQEDETRAIALMLGGLKAGMGFAEFEESLSRAALSHYNDFGHSLIYVVKTRELIKHLGGDVEKPLLLALVRSLVFATREDRIPEFRKYATALSSWGESGDGQPHYSDWHKKGINSALDATLSCSKSDPMSIYNELLTAAAISMLSYDIDQQYKAHVTVSGNVNWLDFSHGITFANAVRQQSNKFPHLWPKGLLQMACFVGRNAAYTTDIYDLENWGTDDINLGISELIAKVLDHGQDEHIVSVHGLKTLQAVRQELDYLDNEKSNLLFAALNRFVNSPIKRRQTRRTAYQSLKFIEKE